jgi:alpha-L-arabinofuranosidase
MNPLNTFEQPEIVKPARFDGASITGSSLRMDLPAISVVSLHMAKACPAQAPAGYNGAG